jgi:ureidoglycolate hydrolase
MIFFQKVNHPECRTQVKLLALKPASLQTTMPMGGGAYEKVVLFEPERPRPAIARKAIAEIQCPR